MAKRPATPAAANPKPAVTEAEIVTTSTGEAVNENAQTGAEDIAGKVGTAVSGAAIEPDAAVENGLSDDGATSGGGLGIASESDIAKAMALIDPLEPMAVIPAGMDVVIQDVRRFATVASPIEHDGEAYAQDDLILLTEKQFEKLRLTGALQEKTWNVCETQF